MVRWLLVSAVGASLLAGCGDSRRPTARTEDWESDGHDVQPAAPHGAFGTPSVGERPHGAGGPEVRLGTMQLTAPERWVRKQPSVDFLLAEFSLPRVEGDGADGRLTITAVGGSVEEIVALWRGQFGGKPERESQEELEVAGVRVTLVDFSGTYGAQHAGLAPASRQPGYRMLTAIFDVEGTQHVVKCYGPEKTMADHADEFLAFVQSLSPIRPGPPEPEPTEQEPTEPEPTQTDSLETPSEGTESDEAPSAETPTPELPSSSPGA